MDPTRPDEAASTVRTKDGRYYDLSKAALTHEGLTTLTDEQFNQVLRNTRLRIAITPQCNLWCQYCSNEGLAYSTKKDKPGDIDLMIQLSQMVLDNSPLTKIDFSGGEPLIHPDFTRGDYKLLNFLRMNPRGKYSIHTNGVELTEERVEQIIPVFSRIGVNVNSFSFQTWSSMTNRGGFCSPEAQRKKFEKLMRNLEYLSTRGIGERVFLKKVVMRGINDSEKDLQEFLGRCLAYKFHPKFLEFEPQYPDQRNLIVGRAELFKELEGLGCQFPEDAPRHNDANTYIPGVNFKYGPADNQVTGLHSIFGCGTPGACASCYDFLCIFIKPDPEGKGLYVKPCSVMDKQIDLTAAIKSGDPTQVLKLIKQSREYLMLRPGLGTVGWNREKPYDPQVSSTGENKNG